MMNNVTLIGRPTKDPDLRYTASGTAVATFTLAVNRNYTNQNGDRETDFINCVIWRKPAETLANYVRKGTLIGISGRLQTRNYENQQGQRVYVTEVIVENFYLLESRSQAEAREQKQKTTQNSTTNNQFSSTASNVDNNDPFN
ncbi:single-stranded DNA-binding protein, partial [Enterococcus faecalis]|nr:single-stranded DNA-binding protein [Enterococcus faecalis]